MQGMVEGLRKTCRPKRKYIDDIKEWTKMDVDEILCEVQQRDKWRCVVAVKLIPPTIFESRD